jgi:hypothetical protein
MKYLVCLFLLLSCTKKEFKLHSYKDRDPAILIPIKFKGMSKPTFFQLDTGSTRSLIKYCKDELAPHSTESGKRFQTHKVEIAGVEKTQKFTIFNTGMKYDCSKIWDKGPIGTIGTDFFKDKILVLDLKSKKFSVASNIEAINKYFKKKPSMTKASFNEGRFILDAKSSASNYRFMYDTGGGTSHFTTEYRTWTKLTNKEKTDKTNTIKKVWSWNKRVNVITNRMDTDLVLAGMKFEKPEISFIEGAVANFQFSKYRILMDGIVSNKGFKDRVLIVDFKNAQFGILRN